VKPRNIMHTKMQFISFFFLPTDNAHLSKISCTHILYFATLALWKEPNLTMFLTRTFSKLYFKKRKNMYFEAWLLVYYRLLRNLFVQIDRAIL
jgi:hypothetical protein